MVYGLRTIRRGKRSFARIWRRVRKPAGVLKLPRLEPGERTKRRALADRERFLEAFERVVREDERILQVLAKS